MAQSSHIPLLNLTLPFYPNKNLDTLLPGQDIVQNRGVGARGVLGLGLGCED